MSYKCINCEFVFRKKYHYENHLKICKINNLNEILSKLNLENKTVIQIGSHIGDSINDPIFNKIHKTTKLFLIEPIPYIFEKLKDNYKNKHPENKNITYINKAVSNFIGEIELSSPSQNNDFSKLPFWASQISSINPNHALKIIPNLIIDKIKVNTTTINDLINNYKIDKIDLLHMDTEGHDYDIIMNYDFKIKPEKILFEHKYTDGTSKTGRKYQKILKKLNLLDYEFISKNNDDTLLELKKNIDIKDDIYTVSNKFRKDIKDFFNKDSKNLKIVEIGSHKGYTTKYLSTIFKKVYPIDLNVKHHQYSRKHNYNDNIEYIHLNLYDNSSWKVIPNDIDIVFIDANHDYEYCKMDLINSLINFPQLKYIIFDDYGVWPGVNKVVKEFIETKHIKIEKNIGLNYKELREIPICFDIANSKNFIINDHEGVICKVLNIPDKIIKPVINSNISNFCNYCGIHFKKNYHFENHKKKCNLDDIKKIMLELNKN
jgi:FkbM family methyltransferase